MTIAETYPCPKCGKFRLIYDGMLAWRSGPRPPRALASKKEFFSPRADYERERCYHCESCSAEFFEDVEMEHRPHLFEEGESGAYVYNQVERCWQRDGVTVESDGDVGVPRPR